MYVILLILGAGQLLLRPSGGNPVPSPQLIIRSQSNLYPAQLGRQIDLSHVLPTKELFWLNLEEGYFACQFNSSDQFLKIFRLSRLCDGVSDCFQASDELAEQLKCASDCSPLCKSGVCLRSRPESQCHCDDGWGGKTCEDQDANECKYRPCSLFAHCTNTLGSFYCTCRPGYTGDGFNCRKEGVDDTEDYDLMNTILAGRGEGAPACSFKGVEYSEGEEIPGVKQCTKCRCINTDIECERVLCPPAPLPTCTLVASNATVPAILSNTISTQASCCPAYDCPGGEQTGPNAKFDEVIQNLRDLIGSLDKSNLSTSAPSNVANISSSLETTGTSVVNIFPGMRLEAVAEAGLGGPFNGEGGSLGIESTTSDDVNLLTLAENEIKDDIDDGRVRSGDIPVGGGGLQQSWASDSRSTTMPAVDNSRAPTTTASSKKSSVTTTATIEPSKNTVVVSTGFTTTTATVVSVDFAATTAFGNNPLATADDRVAATRTGDDKDVTKEVNTVMTAVTVTPSPAEDDIGVTSERGKFTTASIAVVDGFTTVSTAVVDRFTIVSTAALDGFTLANTAAVNRFTTANIEALSGFTTSSTAVVDEFTTASTAAVNRFTIVSTAAVNGITSANTAAVSGFTFADTKAVDGFTTSSTTAVDGVTSSSTAANDGLSTLSTTAVDGFTLANDAAVDGFTTANTAAVSGFTTVRKTTDNRLNTASSLDSQLGIAAGETANSQFTTVKGVDGSQFTGDPSDASEGRLTTSAPANSRRITSGETADFQFTTASDIAAASGSDDRLQNTPTTSSSITGRGDGILATDRSTITSTTAANRSSQPTTESATSQATQPELELSPTLSNIEFTNPGLSNHQFNGWDSSVNSGANTEAAIRVEATSATVEKFTFGRGTSVPSEARPGTAAIETSVVVVEESTSPSSGATTGDAAADSSERSTTAQPVVATSATASPDAAEGSTTRPVVATTVTALPDTADGATVRKAVATVSSVQGLETTFSVTTASVSDVTTTSITAELFVTTASEVTGLDGAVRSTTVSPVAAVGSTTLLSTATASFFTEGPAVGQLSTSRAAGDVGPGVSSATEIAIAGTRAELIAKTPGLDTGATVVAESVIGETTPDAPAFEDLPPFEERPEGSKMPEEGKPSDRSQSDDDDMGGAASLGSRDTPTPRGTSRDQVDEVEVGGATPPSPTGNGAGEDRNKAVGVEMTTGVAKEFRSDTTGEPTIQQTTKIRDETSKSKDETVQTGGATTERRRAETTEEEQNGSDKMSTTSTTARDSSRTVETATAGATEMSAETAPKALVEMTTAAIPRDSVEITTVTPIRSDTSERTGSIAVKIVTSTRETDGIETTTAGVSTGSDRRAGVGVAGAKNGMGTPVGGAEEKVATLGNDTSGLLPDPDSSGGPTPQTGSFISDKKSAEPLPSASETSAPKSTPRAEVEPVSQLPPGSAKEAGDLPALGVVDSSGELGRKGGTPDGESGSPGPTRSAAAGSGGESSPTSEIGNEDSGIDVSGIPAKEDKGSDISGNEVNSFGISDNEDSRFSNTDDQDSDSVISVNEDSSSGISDKQNSGPGISDNYDYIEPLFLDDASDGAIGGTTTTSGPFSTIKAPVTGDLSTLPRASVPTTSGFEGATTSSATPTSSGASPATLAAPSDNSFTTYLTVIGEGVETVEVTGENEASRPIQPEEASPALPAAAPTTTRSSLVTMDIQEKIPALRPEVVSNDLDTSTTPITTTPTTAFSTAAFSTTATPSATTPNTVTPSMATLTTATSTTAELTTAAPVATALNSVTPTVSERPGAGRTDYEGPRIELEPRKEDDIGPECVEAKQDDFFSFSMKDATNMADCSWDFFRCTEKLGVWPANRVCCEGRFKACSQKAEDRKNQARADVTNLSSGGSGRRGDVELSPPQPSGVSSVPTKVIPAEDVNAGKDSKVGPVRPGIIRPTDTPQDVGINRPSLAQASPAVDGKTLLECIWEFLDCREAGSRGEMACRGAFDYCSANSREAPKATFTLPNVGAVQATKDGYLDCIVDLYNCTATFASCRAVFKTCQQNIPESVPGRSGATVASQGTAATGAAVASRPVSPGVSGTGRRTELVNGDGTPSLADGAGKVPEIQCMWSFFQCKEDTAACQRRHDDCIKGNDYDNKICTTVARNPHRYLVAHPTDCTKFYSCQRRGWGGWIANPMDCPPTTGFDTSLMICNYISALPRCRDEGVSSLLVENSEVGISARQTRQRNVEDLAVSQLGYLATDQAALAAASRAEQLSWLSSLVFLLPCVILSR